MKKINHILMFSFLLTLTACTKTQNNNVSTTTPSSTPSESNSETTTNNNATNTNTESTPLKSKALVIYFSATNHTESVANTIANYIEAPIYELEALNSYTSADLNYSNQSSRVVQEHQKIQNGERINVELTNTSFDEFDEATYIFLGAPVWWQQLSWVIENFVQDNDFSNKTIIPFGTSSSSGFNLNNLTSLTEDDTNVTWMTGQRFSSNVNSSTVINWIDSLGLNL